MPDSSDDLNDDDADSNKQRLASLDYPSSLTLAQGEPSAYGTFTGDHGEDGDDGDGGMMILWRCERIIMVSLDGKHGYNRSTGLQWSIGLQKWTQSNKQWDTVGHWTLDNELKLDTIEQDMILLRTGFGGLTKLCG